jgi:hypothetical protein
MLFLKWIKKKDLIFFSWHFKEAFNKPSCNMLMQVNWDVLNFMSNERLTKVLTWRDNFFFLFWHSEGYQRPVERKSMVGFEKK